MSMFEDVAPSFVNRSKATSARLQPNGIYVAIVTRITGTASDRIYVKVPKLGGINEYGPCVVVGIIPSVDDFVLVGFLDNKMSELVAFGTFSKHAPSMEYLADVLDDKAPLANPTFTGTVVLPSTTSIGTVSSTEIGYLDGVTSSVQTQLNSKAALAGPTFTGTVVLPSTTSIGTVSSTELGYVDGVTSAIQTQIDAKAPSAGPTFTGTVVLPSTTSIGTVSSTEIGYVDGVTSAIQTQIDSKLNKTWTIVDNSSATLTLDATHISAVVECSSASATTITIPAESTYNFPVGTEINISWVGAASSVRIARASTSVTANGSTSTSSYFYLRAQWSMVTLLKRASNSWHVFGDFYVA